MKTNCKVGDLVVIKNLLLDSHLNGWMGEALSYIHPNNCWQDPEGHWHANDDDLAMAVKSSGSTFDFPGNNNSHYAIFSMRNLHPIRDLPGEDETLSWAGLPQDAGVTA